MYIIFILFYTDEISRKIDYESIIMEFDCGKCFKCHDDSLRLVNFDVLSINNLYRRRRAECFSEYNDLSLFSEQ